MLHIIACFLKLLIYNYKTKLESASLSCNNHRSKTAISKFCPQIQRTDASDHIVDCHKCKS